MARGLLRSIGSLDRPIRQAVQQAINGIKQALLGQHHRAKMRVERFQNTIGICFLTVNRDFG